MPKLGLGLSLTRTRIGPFYDPDARLYFNAVEAADGQDLEGGVKAAINTFIIGLKSDGILNQLYTCCILAGARTLAGALVPLRGAAPTNNNFVGGDYNRKTGLIGNGTNKFLATGYNNNDTTNFPQNNSHISCYITESQTNGTGIFVGTQSALGNILSINYGSTTQINFRNRSSTGRLISVAPVGFQVSTRNNSANFSSRATYAGGTKSDVTTTATSGTPSNQLYGVFCGFSGATPNGFCSARMSFYSIGKDLSIPAFDLRVTALMGSLNAAIP